MATIERPTTGQAPGPLRRRSIIVLLAFILFAVVGAAIWTITSEDEEKTPVETVQDLAAAMRNDDVDKVNELLRRVDPSSDQAFGELLVWSMALKAEPTLSDCTTVAYGVAAEDKVTCEFTFGEDYFYSQVLGETLTTTFGAYVLDESTAGGMGPGAADWIGVADFDTPVGETPDGVLGVELEFRAWVEQTHPELVDEVWRYSWDKVFEEPLEEKFATDVLFYVASDHEAGVLRMELLPEFLASR